MCKVNCTWWMQLQKTQSSVVMKNKLFISSNALCCTSQALCEDLIFASFVFVFYISAFFPIIRMPIIQGSMFSLWELVVQLYASETKAKDFFKVSKTMSKVVLYENHISSIQRVFSNFRSSCKDLLEQLVKTVCLCFCCRLIKKKCF